MKSLHIIGSKAMGGAERWFVRFLNAMDQQGEPVAALTRTGSELTRPGLIHPPLEQVYMGTVWDPFAKAAVARAIRQTGAPLVQTYMGRATRLTHLKPGRGVVHLSRLGGYYKVGPFLHAHAWVGNTRGLCDWMVQQGLPADRVFHIYNFAEPALPPAPGKIAALRQELDVQPEDWLIVTAGRMIEVKGQRHLIDALARLPAEVAGRRPRLVVLGDGPLRGALEAQARQLGVASRIHWAGWQHDPAPWFHLADMVAFPSEDAETLGNVILEAWAYGKPLVCTAFRGAREIARHGEDAWVAPCGDAIALARGMEQVMGEPALAAALVQAGGLRVEKDFGEAEIIRQYRQLYEHLLDIFGR
ncbi:MAG: glycosyltransferase [Pseudomonadota bacterium]